MNIKYDTICMSGGSIKGFAFIGALKHLEDNNHINLSNVNHYVGTSAGSMISFFLSLDYSLKEIEDFIISFNFKKLIPEFNIENILISHGIDYGEKIMFVVMNFLKEKYNLDDITFEEHYKLTNKKLTIIGTNFTKSCEESFNYINTPNMSVKTAIRISISIPIMFTPVLYNDNYYVDGGIINNFPINHCNPETTLGIYIKNSCLQKMDNILTLFTGCLNIFVDTISTKYFYHLKNYNIIEIEDNNPELTNFDIDNEKKQSIINMGIICAKKFIEQKKLDKPKEEMIKDSSTQTDFNKDDKITKDFSTQTD
jgi:predicted patatin/cPLA2 family phospholipase